MVALTLVATSLTGLPWLSIAFRKGKSVVGDIAVNGGDTGRGVVGGGAG